jgi:3-methylcrotonyl-CoA carboxylase alpha subunit
VIHLFERDCSLQRRHQKVIEEAPAPGMTPEVRAAMGRAAVEAAAAIGYEGAGTVEFIVDGSGPLRTDGFWFMEMNTRLQVEHPVSEAITGLDFVELQLRVAAGERLPVTQDEVSIDGWSFEARVYAEDVAKGFLPATGTLAHLAFPEAVEFGPGPVRVDAGVRAGDVISPWYDPMIAKVVVHGPTRPAALNRLHAALAACEVVGSVTNVGFLTALARHSGFAAGDVDTGLIGRDLELLTPAEAPDPELIALAALGSVGLLDPTGDAPAVVDPWDRPTGFRHWGPGRHHAGVVTEAGDAIEVTITTHGPGHHHVARSAPDEDDPGVDVRISPLGQGRHSVGIDDRRFTASVVVVDDRVAVFCDGRTLRVRRPDPLVGAGGDGSTGDVVVAPMPGLVKVVSVAAGDRVEQGQSLVVLEAMKMEHTLAAHRSGIVAEVAVAVGDQVGDGDLLLALEPLDSAET